MVAPCPVWGAVACAGLRGPLRAPCAQLRNRTLPKHSLRQALRASPRGLLLNQVVTICWALLNGSDWPRWRCWALGPISLRSEDIGRGCVGYGPVSGQRPVTKNLARRAGFLAPLLNGSGLDGVVVWGKWAGGRPGTEACEKNPARAGLLAPCLCGGGPGYWAGAWVLVACLRTKAGYQKNSATRRVFGPIS